jgi:hypothetical protein
LDDRGRKICHEDEDRIFTVVTFLYLGIGPRFQDQPALSFTGTVTSLPQSHEINQSTFPHFHCRVSR